MRRAIRVEWWKFRRSRVVITATGLMSILLPAMGLGFFVVAVSGGNGVLADKAGALLTAEGWPGYLGLVDQIAAVATFLGVGVVVAWAFGREHVDRTFPSLFALPVSRSAIAGAKFVVLVGWILTLSILISLAAAALGVVGGVGPWDTGEIWPGVARLSVITIGAGALALTMALFASVGRGYLPAIGAVIVIIAIAQVAVLLGTGGWFPFAVPGLLAVAGAEGAPELTAAQLGLVPALAAAGIWLTLLWWGHSEVS